MRIFEGRIFAVDTETVRLPDGRTRVVEIVRHPGSVVILPLTEDGRLVLVRQFRPAIGRSTWELPAGSLNPGENVEAAARRECHEETGLIPGALRPLGAFFPTPGYCDEQMHFFEATDLRTPGGRDEPAHRDEDEDIEVESFTLDRLRALIASGDIIDLKTVAGLALLIWAHGRRIRED